MLGRWFRRGNRLNHEDPAVRLEAVEALSLEDASSAQDALVDRALSDDSIDVRTAAIGKIIVADELGALLEQDTVASDAAKRIAELIQLGKPCSCSDHPLVVEARIAAATPETTTALLPSITSAEQAAELALQLPVEAREPVFALAVLRSEAGLSTLEKRSRGRDKNCNRHARERIDLLKAAHADLRSAQERLIELDAAVAKELNHHPQNANALIVHRQKLIKLKDMRTTAVADVNGAADKLTTAVGEPVSPNVPEDPLQGVDLSIPDPENDPYEPLVQAMQALTTTMRQCTNLDEVSLDQVAKERDELTRNWLESADKVPARADQHEVFESFSHEYQSFRSAFERLQEFAAPPAPVPLDGDTQKDKMRALLDARSSWKKAAQKSISRLRWPEGYAIPPQLSAVVDALPRVDAEIEKLRDLQTERKDSVDQLTELLGTAIEQGKVTEARNALRKIRQLQKSGTRGAEHEINALAARLDELRDWQSFATHPKRDELLQAVTELAERPLSPPDQASKLKEIRAAWNQLGQPSNVQETQEQEQFDKLAETAFETCKAHYEEQAAQRSRNLEARKNLCLQLRTYLDETDWQTADMKAAENIMRQARQEWRKHHPCERKSLKSVEAEFEALQSSLHAKVKDSWDSNIAAKKALVERAQALLESEDAQGATNEAKDLQREWKAVGPTPRGVDQRLWREFRKVCDELFARRDAAGKAREDARRESHAALEQAIAGLESAVAQGNVDRRQLRDVEAQAAEVRADRAQRNRLDAVRDQLREQEQHAARQEAEASLRQFHDWDVAVSQAEVSGSAIDVPHAMFEARVSGTSNDEDLLQLALEAEIAADIASPQDFQSARMALQIELMNSGFRNLDHVSNDELIERWCGFGPKGEDAGPTRERFFAALAKRL